MMKLNVNWVNGRSCCMALVLFVLIWLISFNVHYLQRDIIPGDATDSTVVAVNNDDTSSTSHLKYLVVIGSQVAFGSRRELIRSSYFGIKDNLIPIIPFQRVQYAFCIHGNPPTSNTPEKRIFETEKMEYNDIYTMDKSIEFTQDNVLNWIKTSLLKQKNINQDFDYIIVQDIHSFIPLDKLMHAIESKGDKNMIWGKNEKGFVIGSVAFKDSRKDKIVTSLPSQLWENSIESTNTNNLLIGNVYQDGDFQVLREKYGLKPIELEKSKSKQVVVTSSYIYDRCMEPSGTKASLNKRDYADKHNYAFVARSREFAQQVLRPDTRRTVWGKIDVIQKVLPKYEWLFWLDMDAVVMNDKISVEELIQDLKKNHYDGSSEEFDKEINFIIVRPGTDKMINAGVFLIKNTAWSFEFLQDIQKREEWYRQGPSYEQGAMWDMMREDKYIKNTLYLDRENHIFNTFPKFYQDQDFIVHFAPDKCPNAATLKGLAAADKIKQGQKITSSDLL